MKLKTDKSVTFETLKEELQAKRQRLDNTTMIIIQGDETDKIMDIARQAGLVLFIATEPQPIRLRSQERNLARRRWPDQTNGPTN